MEWHLTDIVIIGKDGTTRQVELKRGVNIITGESQTGKSALIGIVDYCMGSGSYRVPVGPIREFAAWYAIKIQTQSEQLLIGRKEPGSNNSTDVMHMVIGQNIVVPPLEELLGNTDRDAVVSELSRRLGMMTHTLAESRQDVDYTQSPTYRNITAFLFQPQGLIANQNVLFYDTDPVENRNERRRLQRILPYALGAIDSEHFVQRKRLDEFRMRRRQLSQERDEQIAIAGEASGVYQTLVGRAAELGLSSEATALSDGVPKENSWTRVRSELSQLAEKAEASPLNTVTSDAERSPAFTEQERQLRERLLWLRHQLRATQQLEFQTRNANNTINSELGRLRAIDLFRSVKRGRSECPLCNQELEHQVPAIDDILSTQRELEFELLNIQLAVPSVGQHIAELRKAILESKSELSAVETRLAAEFTQSDSTLSVVDDWASRQRLAGAIRFYLEQTVDVTGTTVNQADMLREVESEISELEDRLNVDESKERLDSALRVVSEMMGELAKLLPLELPDLPLSIDPNRLTVVRHSTRGRPERMSEIGSAENWLSYHLCAFFALHEFFLVAERPVPSFLFLDQPSQVYFPEELWNSKETDTAARFKRQSDLEKVRQIYTMVFKTVNRLGNRLQVILIDHASLLEEEFQNAVRANWRDGRHLV